MLRIHLLDPKGRPHLALNQPEPVSDQMDISMWLTVFSAVGNNPDGTIEVRFKMARGPQATGLINGKYRRLEIINGNYHLFLTAEDILPDPVSF